MTKPDLLLLHGALGDATQFRSLTLLLAEHFIVHSVNFEGHGNTSQRDRPFRIEHFVSNTIEYLADNSIESTHMFGFSMGGFVACQLASAHPDKVRSIATLGTKFYWDAETAARETGLLDPDKIKAKVPHFAAALETRHTAFGWENVLRSTSDLLVSLGETGGLRASELSQIQCPVRVMLGDRDRTVGVQEAYEVYRALPQGQLQVLPATPHEFERIDSEQLAQILLTFFSS